MRDWVKRKPILILRGKGAVLLDQRGKEYLDANSSIWTNLHGHNHPKINAAIRRQVKMIAHSSARGLANEPASLLAEELVQLANAGIYDLSREAGQADFTIYEAGGERVSERTYPAGNTPAGTPALAGNRKLTK